MVVSYFISNFMPLMILLTLVSLMFVNREVKIPASNLFAVSVFIMFALTVIGTLNIKTDISGLSPEEAANVIFFRTLTSTLNYILRPCVILSELLIILRGRKYRIICAIPAVINAAIYASTLFGGRIAFFIDNNNNWCGGPLSITVYIVQLLYLIILLCCSVRLFNTGDKRKNVILIIMFLQAVLVAVLERENVSDYTDSITALCILEYYIYLATVYRQELNHRLDNYMVEIREAGIRYKNLTKEVMEALASAIDAKDTYTNGHSLRVAEYSRKIAEAAGMDDEDCENIYDAALLHDVGKIGVPIEILTKKSRLTDEEFKLIRDHPVVGSQILSRISETPWLSIGARYHHERYNGNGYPEGLTGEDIPEIARIIAVADAYDAMTSNRSYRDAIPQHIVREELAKGIGTQFDPEFAKIMIHLIDLDTEYRMKESISGANVSAKAGLRCESIYNDCTDGVTITRNKTCIRICSQPDDGYPDDRCLPTLIIFDALDGKVHPGEENNKDLLYYEYARIRLDGRVTAPGVRKSELRVNDSGTDIERPDLGDTESGQKYKIVAVRNRDHAFIRVSSEKQMFDVILALPDTARYTFISITGEHCEIHNIKVDTDETAADSGFIPRIAEEISYTKGCPEGNIPNIEVDGPRLASSVGVPITDNMTISFHTMSYPTARLVWHCPYICVFASSNGQVDGDDFREYLLLKMDGENWKSTENVDNKVSVDQADDFESWDHWMDQNKLGLDCTVKIRRENNVISMRTENAGVFLSSVTTILDGTQDIFVAITGDQCAVTDIHIKNE